MRQQLQEYKNVDFRLSSLDAIGRLTRSDIIWACTCAETIGGTTPLITPSQLDPAFSKMKGYRAYYTTAVVLRNKELAIPNRQLKANCPVMLFLGRKMAQHDMEAVASAQKTPIASKQWNMVVSSAQNYVFDTILIDPRFPLNLALAPALRKMQALFPKKQLTTLIMPNMPNANVFRTFVRFSFHQLGTQDYKRFVPWSPPQPCFLVFSTQIMDNKENK